MTIDTQGNYNDVGIHYVHGRKLEEIVDLIKRELAKELPDVTISIKTQKYSMGQSINIEILDAGERDIVVFHTKEALEQRVRDIAERFNQSRGNVYQDYSSTTYYTNVRTASSAFAAHAARNGGVSNPVESKMTLSAFKRTVKPGDRFDILHGGRERVRIVSQVRSNDLAFVDENGANKSYLSFGKASNFACDGELVRFAIGHEYDPDRHLLYRWVRS